MSTRAVIFDLDDTLISETGYAMSGLNCVAGVIESRGMAGKSRQEIFSELTSLFNEDHGNVFNRFLLNNGISDDRDRVMELVNTYREHFPDIDYFEDVRPVLRILKDRGIMTGILSDGYKITQRQKIRALGAEEDFDIIILTDEIGRDAWKPSPKGFEVIEERTGIRPEEMLYVGDNPEKDFYLSESAGIKTARIKRENGVYNNRSYYKGVTEDYAVDSLYEIPDIL